MPTFREQCEKLFANPSKCQGLWLGLYYAILAVGSMVHLEEESWLINAGHSISYEPINFARD